MARRRLAVTIRHVAADAGVSLQTVSRVINDSASVSAAMRKRVQASIDKLGYVPSIAAQRMGGSRSYLILAINDRDRTIADWCERQGTDWVDQMLLGGMLKCAEFGYRLMIELVDTHSDHVERELRATIAALQPDGVILTPPHSENPLITGLLSDQKITFARIGSIAAGDGIPLTMDDEHAARLATEHLAGLDCRVLLVEGDFSFDSGLRAARRLLNGASEPVTAIIASNDRMTLACLEFARDKGLAIPADLSLVSFDNTPIIRFAQPPLTAIDQPVAETTARAVELIIAAQRGRPPPEGPIVVPARLVERQSTAAPRAPIARAS